jgi:GTP diphosphokinase / guanosine-3',5'-bis(diphosphate) 3'-diphosphatase
MSRQKIEFSDKLLAKAVPRLGHRTGDDVLSAVGRGELAAADVLKAMGLVVDEADVKTVKRRMTASKSRSGSKDALPVRGAAAGTILKFHERTGAVPGERIVGISTPGEGLTIYPIFAQALEQFDQEPERWVDLAWGAADTGQRFPARISLSIINEVGALAQITQAIGDKGGNIDGLSMKARSGVRDFFELEILVEVFDLKHLNEIISEIKGKSSVSDVTRVTS